MREESIAFALNHITCCRDDHRSLAQLAAALGLAAVEIRNDIADVALADGTTPAIVAQSLSAAGVRALSVNALQRFNDWNENRAIEADALAAATRASGAEALVLCPVNQSRYWTADRERLSALRDSLAALRPILDRHGVAGFVEPLGFESSSLRFKREAIEAVDAVNGANTYQLLHDTFHHAIASDPDVYPERTGLVHVSGVSVPNLALTDMRDDHRVLVDEHDRIDNIGQIATLRLGGYSGFFSVECFAESVQNAPDLASRLAGCITFIKHRLASSTRANFT